MEDTNVYVINSSFLRMLRIIRISRLARVARIMRSVPEVMSHGGHGGDKIDQDGYNNWLVVWNIFYLSIDWE